MDMFTLKCLDLEYIPFRLLKADRTTFLQTKSILNICIDM